MLQQSTLALGLLTVLLCGCNRGPTAVPQFHVNAKSAARRALDLYDKNDDGSLDQAELTASPGLGYALSRNDANHNGDFEGDEIVNMVESWNEKTTGLLSLRCTVTMKRRPVAGATVTLIPEPFLDGEIETAVGRTDEFGDAQLSIPKERRPIADSPPGVQIGLYSVEISRMKGNEEAIPDRYNSATTLGQEVSHDDPRVLNGIRYELK